MSEGRKKEIIVKGINVSDTQFGPRIGIVDQEGKWYNSSKSKWSKLPGTWEGLTGLKAGDRVLIDWEIKSYVAKDGSPKATNDIVGFDIIIRPQDEVIPLEGPCLPRETTTVPKSIVMETGARQTCLNCATQLEVAVLTASVAAGLLSENISDPVGNILNTAKKLYASLKEPW